MNFIAPPELATLKTNVLGAFEGEDVDGITLLVVPNLLTFEQAKEKACPELDQTLKAVRDLMSTIGGQLTDWRLYPSGTGLDLRCQLSRSNSK